MCFQLSWLLSFLHCHTFSSLQSWNNFSACQKARIPEELQLWISGCWAKQVLSLCRYSVLLLPLRWLVPVRGSSLALSLHPALLCGQCLGSVCQAGCRSHFWASSCSLVHATTVLFDTTFGNSLSCVLKVQGLTCRSVESSVGCPLFSRWGQQWRVLERWWQGGLSEISCSVPCWGVCRCCLHWVNLCSNITCFSWYHVGEVVLRGRSVLQSGERDRGAGQGVCILCLTGKYKSQFRISQLAKAIWEMLTSWLH